VHLVEERRRVRGRAQPFQVEPVRVELAGARGDQRGGKARSLDPVERVVELADECLVEPVLARPHAHHPDGAHLFELDHDVLVPPFRDPGARRPRPGALSITAAVAPTTNSADALLEGSWHKPTGWGMPRTAGRISVRAQPIVMKEPVVTPQQTDRFTAYRRGRWSRPAVSRGARGKSPLRPPLLGPTMHTRGRGEQACERARERFGIRHATSLPLLAVGGLRSSPARSPVEGAPQACRFLPGVQLRPRHHRRPRRRILHGVATPPDDAAGHRVLAHRRFAR